jgi:CRISPR-associated protein Cas1
MAKNNTNPRRNLEANDAPEAESVATIDTWAARSKHWLEQSQPQTSRRRREREKNPLFLTGHGLSIRVDRGCLVVRDGHTHYPTEETTWRFFSGSLDIPPALIVIDGSGEITMDALDWLGRQEVPLIRLRWDGEFVSVVTSGGQAASTDKVAWQRQTRNSDRRRVEFGLPLIRRKAQNTLVTMEEYVPKSSAWDKAYKNIATRVRWLEDRPPKRFSNLLGIEGAVANEYFRAWSAVSLKWRITKKDPIPDDWGRFKSRAALRPGRRRAYRATHPVNAMLNYAYGLLTARTQIQLISKGYDPMIGVMHDEEEARGTYPAFALDQMEPMRPVVDRAVLQLVESETFSGSDFSIQHDGVCRLNPQLARRVAQLVLSLYAEVRKTEWLKQES